MITGSRHASRVVTAAALIMFSVFASFVTAEDLTLKPIALGLAVGIVVDAFLIRMTLVPAILALVGKSAWWLPRRLDRMLPDLEPRRSVPHRQSGRSDGEHGRPG